jgi:dipeptidase D
MSFVAELEPSGLWQHFDRILGIPRPSKGEEKMREHVISLAQAAGLEHDVDDAGNVVVRKPGTSGHENAPITILQAHLDMVQEKNSDVDHDWVSSPIQPQQDGDFIKATGTTLGSDNGIGVAAMLAIMEDGGLEHGPLELLFTIDEETGLTGAAELDGSLLQGRRLINLDSEEEGTLTVGCAGGKDSQLSLPIETAAPPADVAGLSIKLRGLKGGHSGVDIHLQRGNATKLLVRALNVARAGRGMQIAELAGGNAHNAVPREAHATVAVAPGDLDGFKADLEAELAAIQAEFKPAEPGFEWEVEGYKIDEVWTEASTDAALRLIEALPHGVMSMSYDIAGLVETSTNLATVERKSTRGGEVLSIGLSSRSSVQSALDALARRIRATGELAGCSVAEGGGYPGWQPDMDSELLGVMKGLHEQVIGTVPEVGAIHAGLECGIIGEKVPGMDMISFGPTIQFPHSPDERVEVPTVARFYDLLTTTLSHLAKSG